jgi:hypothetical protein
MEEVDNEWDLRKERHERGVSTDRGMHTLYRGQRHAVQGGKSIQNGLF